MPYGDPDPDDPSILVSVALPGDAAATRAMAEAFADEFARFGYDEAGIFALFADPFYEGAHAALGALGVPALLRIIQESVARWPRVRIVDTPAPGSVSTPARRRGTPPGAREPAKEA